MFQERSEKQAPSGDYYRPVRRSANLHPAEGNTHDQQSDLTETLPMGSSASSYTGLNEARDDSLSATEIGAVLTLVALLGSLVVTQFAKQFSRWIFWKTLQDRLSYTKPQKIPQIPCTNCRFFNQNPYLKCTVHPDRALTPAAMHCTDYWSNQSDRFSR